MIGINPATLRVALGGCGVLLSVLTLQSGGQTGSASHEQSSGSSVSEVALPAQTSPLVNSSLKKYSDGINPGLFGEGELTKLKPAPVPFKKATPVVSPPTANPPDPLANLVYTGFVHSNEQEYALIEDRKTRQGWYLQVGDALGDGVVSKIEAGGIEIKPSVEGQSPRILAMNSRYSLTPLDKGAIGGDEARQVEVMSGEEKLVELDLSGTMYKHWLTDTSSVLLNQRISEEEAQHLMNEVSEGRITAEEAANRGLRNAESPASLILSYKVLSNWSYDDTAAVWEAK
jgi:hypothetical protein